MNTNTRLHFLYSLFVASRTIEEQNLKLLDLEFQQALLDFGSRRWKHLNAMNVIGFLRVREIEQFNTYGLGIHHKDVLLSQIVKKLNHPSIFELIKTQIDQADFKRWKDIVASLTLPHWISVSYVALAFLKTLERSDGEIEMGKGFWGVIKRWCALRIFCNCSGLAACSLT